MRIKSLLGKTANLTFRFVTNNDQDSFGAEKLSYEDESEEDALVSKRIILSGDNLLDAQPRMDSQTNETVVSFTLDRVGAKRFGKATSTGIGKQLAIVLDGKIISAPVIRDTIASGSGQISGGVTFQSATDLALLLRSGGVGGARRPARGLSRCRHGGVSVLPRGRSLLHGDEHPPAGGAPGHRADHRRGSGRLATGRGRRPAAAEKPGADSAPWRRHGGAPVRGEPVPAVPALRRAPGTSLLSTTDAADE